MLNPHIEATSIREPALTRRYLQVQGRARVAGKARAMGLETLFTAGSSTEPSEGVLNAGGAGPSENER